jgi:dephospho-CoA kinase
MITFAITGGIATGKSTVTNIIVKKHKVPVVDADVIAREIVEIGKPCLAHLVNAFSTAILNTDGSLNRKYLGDLCFKDKVALDTINRIMGKVIKEESFKQIQDLHGAGNSLVGYDSALIIESGNHELYKPIIVVTCSPEVQLSRLMSRNNLTEEEATARISAQMSLEEKVKYADYVINNDGGLTELNSEIESVVEKLKQL